MKKLIISIFIASCVFSIHAQWSPSEWPVLKTYDQDHLYNISLPIGGIGTGVIGLGGRGELRDWEIQNKPSKGYSTMEKRNDAPFFSIWVKPSDKPSMTRGLLGPLHPTEYLQYEITPVNQAGIPRFENASFEAAYPFGQVILTDDNVPVKVRIKGFNPLIPGDSDASGIPIAILSYEVENTSDTPLEVSVCGSMRNFVGQDGTLSKKDWKGIDIPYGAKNNVNKYRETETVSGIYMYSDSVNKDDAAWGTIALTTNAKQGVSYRTSSTLNSWSNAILDFWDDFSDDGTLTEKDEQVDHNPMASLAVKQVLEPRAKKTFTFFITWNFPNRLGWTKWEDPDHDKTIYGNYYSKFYADAWDVAEKTVPRLPWLEKKTKAFVEAVAKSDMPAVIKESALSNLNVLRSQTTFRLADGHFMGWEGTMDETGSCPGSCTHVWNYEQATPFLFGDLAMTMRNVELNYATNEIGAMAFRTALPLDKAALPTNQANPARGTAADGQMGCVMKVYREWQLSGDNNFLRENWPTVKKILAFAWIENGWDGNQDGVMEGSQHNTMDINYFGPNPQVGLWYLGALKAASEMAKSMKDKDFERKCTRLFAQGSQWLDANLFNGEYYIHKITDPENYEQFLDMRQTEKIPKYQLGDCCFVDQLVGQYMAYVCGLGYLVKPENIQTTLKSIMKYNFMSDFSAHFVNNRTYALGKESGLLIATWPRERLKVPFPYFAEVWTGFEYAVASTMLYEGMNDDALKCMQAVRDRFDGYKRNPFSEPECGHHYVRSMSSWAGILAVTDFQYSGVDKSMSITSRPGTYFWSNGYAWGTCKVENRKVTIDVLHGDLKLSKITLKGAGSKKIKDTVISEGTPLVIEV